MSKPALEPAVGDLLAMSFYGTYRGGPPRRRELCIYLGRRDFWDSHCVLRGGEPYWFRAFIESDVIVSRVSDAG